MALLRFRTCYRILWCSKWCRIWWLACNPRTTLDLSVAPDEVGKDVDLYRRRNDDMIKIRDICVCVVYLSYLLLMHEIRLTTWDVYNPVHIDISLVAISWLARFLPSTGVGMQHRLIPSRLQTHRWCSRWFRAILCCRFRWGRYQMPLSGIAAEHSCSFSLIFKVETNVSLLSLLCFSTS